MKSIRFCFPYANTEIEMKKDGSYKISGIQTMAGEIIDFVLSMAVASKTFLIIFSLKGTLNAWKESKTT